MGLTNNKFYWMLKPAIPDELPDIDYNKILTTLKINANGEIIIKNNKPVEVESIG